MKQLKIWNGRGYVVVDRDREPFKTWARENKANGGRLDPHLFVCAYSAADVKRLVTEYLGCTPRGLAVELRDYWSKGCWGVQMVGITPERGLWVTRGFGSEPPVRLI